MKFPPYTLYVLYAAFLFWPSIFDLKIYKSQRSRLTFKPRSLILDFHRILFLSETTRPIDLYFHIKTHYYSEGTEVYTNGPSHMTKMAPMPI